MLFRSSDEKIIDITANIMAIVSKVAVFESAEPLAAEIMSAEIPIASDARRTINSTILRVCLCLFAIVVDVLLPEENVTNNRAIIVTTYTPMHTYSAISTPSDKSFDSLLNSKNGTYSIKNTMEIIVDTILSRLEICARLSYTGLIQLV